MKPYWVSWYSAGSFFYVGPWWVSGLATLDSGQETIRAAVMADSEEDAKRRIAEIHDDKTVTIEWRFVLPKASDWSPFDSRFRQAGWMKWPWPNEATQ